MAAFGIAILVKSREIISSVALWTGFIAGSALMVIAGTAATGYLLKRRFRLQHSPGVKERGLYLLLCKAEAEY